MTSQVNLEYEYLLPRRARKIAEVMAEFDGIEKDELEKELRRRDDFSGENLERPVRLLRMTDNVEVKGDKAFVKDREVTCQGIKVNPLKNWERKAIRENEGNLAKIKEERGS